jgi:murein DD-endopeptidase MepM/ murein hydrolase activator NlpD
MERLLQRASVLLDRIRALVAPSPDDESTASGSVPDVEAVVSRIVSRLRALDGLEKLVPIGLCVLLAAAALVSSLPAPRHVSAAAATQPPTAAVVAGGSVPSRQFGVGDGPEAADVNDLYFGDGSIANTMQIRAAGTDVRALLTTYTIRSGDTIAKVAARFGLASTTIYWANKPVIPDPSRLRIGQTFQIPPMDGLIVKVGPKDTLPSLAKKYGIEAQDIIDANNLPEATVVLGEAIIIPGASGGPIPKPKVVKPAASVPVGGWHWPIGGDNYISQFYWSGHRAIDIATAYGSPIYAAVGGTVVYAGWRSYTGGGNVIWVREGAKLYTTYNHLSAWSVHVGQTIKVGQVIGRVGTSGVATGPHLHFEVWLGYPWALGNNSDAVNPCRYLAGC